MFPNEPFRQGGYDRIPRFSSQIERSSDRRQTREMPGRSQSTRIETYPMRESPVRKASTLPTISKMDLSGQQKEFMLLSLPTDFETDKDDPLNEIIELQNSISSKVFASVQDGFTAMTKGADIIGECPHLSKTSMNVEQTSYELEGRFRYVDQIQDGSATSLDDLL